jgi:hypothetical protein
MPAKARLKSRGHSGRLRPHEHTSYGALAFLVLVVGALLALFTVSSFASASPPPAASSVSLSGVMPENPPTTAATITDPTPGEIFSNTPITVSGTCPINTLVEIFKNDIFAGSTPCTSSGNYSVQTDLLYGQDALTAVVYDQINQAGPSSKAITVTYNVNTPVEASLLNFNFTATQLVLNTNAVYRGTFPGQQLNVPINILGGVGPFALNVNWGDNTNSVLPSSTNTTINAEHTYSRPGTYKISIQASDSQQHVAFLDVAAIVNGQPATAAGISGSSTSSTSNKLLVLWPFYAIAATLVVSFYFGERREKHVLSGALRPLPSLKPSSHVTH